MKTWSLNKKFALILSVFVLNTITIASYGVVKLKSISDDFNQVTDVELKELNLIRNMREARAQIASTEKDMIIADDLPEIQSYAREMEVQAGKYLELLKQLEATAPESEKAQIEEIKRYFGELVSSQQILTGYALANKDREAHGLCKGKLKELNDKLGTLTRSLLNAHDKSMNDLADESERVTKNTRFFFFIFGVSSLMFGIGLAFLVLRATSRKVNEVISRLESNATQVASASSQIASSSTELSASTALQSTALQETTSSVEELSAMTLKNTDSADRTAHLSGATQESAEKGREVMMEMVVAMRDIDQGNKEISAQMEQSNQRLTEIVQIICDVDSKTKVINDIVFQTKLLSFNASVEAARAGEHGKGFAVVAEEVGNLARMSGGAAQEITGLLNESIQKVNSIVQETRSRIEQTVSLGRQKVEAGSRVAQDCEKVLSEILRSSTELKEMAGSIASASKEQSQGISEINKAMSQLDEGTQQNAAVSVQASSAAESLSGQAHDLSAVVAELMMAILGKNSTLSKAATSVSRTNAKAMDSNHLAA